MVAESWGCFEALGCAKEESCFHGLVIAVGSIAIEIYIALSRKHWKVEEYGYLKKMEEIYERKIASHSHLGRHRHCLSAAAESLVIVEIRKRHMKRN